MLSRLLICNKTTLLKIQTMAFIKFKFNLEYTLQNVHCRALYKRGYIVTTRWKLHIWRDGAISREHHPKIMLRWCIIRTQLRNILAGKITALVQKLARKSPYLMWRVVKTDYTNQFCLFLHHRLIIKHYRCTNLAIAITTSYHFFSIIAKVSFMHSPPAIKLLQDLAGHYIPDLLSQRIMMRFAPKYTQNIANVQLWSCHNSQTRSCCHKGWKRPRTQY